MRTWTNGKDRSSSDARRLLREEPSEVVIDAVSSVADEECIVLLGRIARSMPALSDVALDTLESIDHHRASAIAVTIRGCASAMT